MKRLSLAWLLICAPIATAFARDPQISSCMADNNKENKAINALRDKASASKDLGPADAKDLASLTKDLNATEKKLAKDDQTAADCAALAKELKGHRAAIEKFLTGLGKVKPSPVAACVAEQQKQQQALSAAATKEEGVKSLKAGQLYTLKDIEANLKADASTLAKAGLTLDQCADIGKDLAAQSKALDKLPKD